MLLVVYKLNYFWYLIIFFFIPCQLMDCLFYSKYQSNVSIFYKISVLYETINEYKQIDCTLTDIKAVKFHLTR